MLTIQNARLLDQSGLVDIETEDGVITYVGPHREETRGEVIDARGNLTIPPLIDPHVHLDAVLTAGKPRYNNSGTHPEGVQVWGEYKQAYPNFEDFDERATRAVEWEVAQGATFIRTHIDTCDPNLTALKKMLALREKLSDIATIQIVAFPQDGILTDKVNEELLEEAMKMGADMVGGIPHCEWTREDGVNSIDVIFRLAKKYDRDIDIHCDETDDPHSRFLETLAAQTIRNDYQGRVSAGHTTAMHSYNDAYAFKLQSLLQKADVNIIANPFDNIVLMGRFDSYPKRRGITRVKELLEAGVNVAMGHDSIMDPWYPLGKGDMLEAALLAVHICHMSGTAQIRRMFDTVTVNSARIFGIEESYGIKVGNPADMVVLDCAGVLDAMRLCPARLHVIRKGRQVAGTTPARSLVTYPDRLVPVDFNMETPSK